METYYDHLKGKINTSKIIYDTSAILEVYKYSLLSSKRILDFFKTNQEKLWLPHQVKKEFYDNQKTVRKMNLYKNLKKELNNTIQSKKRSLFAEFKVFENKRFSDFGKLKLDLEKKFEDMNKIIEEYDQSLVQEATIYKEFIKETDEFLDELFDSNKVGEGLNTEELIELLKEGEVRYKYFIPPGYGDGESKEGLDKFGDLIIWKEILKQVDKINEDTVIFVTSDTEKGDWFEIKSQDMIYRPRKELQKEFQYYHPQKDIVIVPFNNFIELILEDSNPSDKEILIELRANRFVGRIENTPTFLKMIEEIVEIEEVNNHKLELSSLVNDSMKEFIVRLFDIKEKKSKVVDVNYSISIRENKVLYLMDLIVEFVWEVVSDRDQMLSHGSLSGTMKVDLVLERDFNESEQDFLTRFNKGYREVLTLQGITFDKVEYIWGSDENIYTPVGDEGFYTTCPQCSEEINFYNDAKNGFCISCS